MPSLRLLLPPAAVAAALGLAACGSDDDTMAASAPAPTAQPAQSTNTATTPATPASTMPAASATGRRLARTRGRSPAVQTVARGLEVPWDIAFLPDGRALVTEREGNVRLVSRNRRLQRAPVARVATSALGEGGLLGLDVDPDFADGQPFAYLFVTTASGIEIQRWRWTGSRLRRDAVVLDGIRAGVVHDSGRLRFGPDDHLYVATGDAGQGSLAQRRSSLNGKFLRLTPAQYRSSTNDPEVWSVGHRNPQGLDWQPRSNRLVATEHGPSGGDGPQGFDEINVIRRGRNYGWPDAFGPDHRGFARPARLYREALAPSGAAFVSLPGSSWTGDYVAAFLRGQQLRRLSFSGARVTGDRPLFRGRYGRLRAVVEAPDGALWITTSNRDGRGSPGSGDDRILRVIPPRG